MSWVWRMGSWAGFVFQCLGTARGGDGSMAVPLSPQAPGGMGGPARAAAQGRGADGRGEGNHQPRDRPRREDGGDGAGAHRVGRAGDTQGGTRRGHRDPGAAAGGSAWLLSWAAASALQSLSWKEPAGDFGLWPGGTGQGRSGSGCLGGLEPPAVIPGITEIFNQ